MTRRRRLQRWRLRRGGRYGRWRWRVRVWTRRGWINCWMRGVKPSRGRGRAGVQEDRLEAGNRNCDCQWTVHKADLSVQRTRFPADRCAWECGEGNPCLKAVMAE